MFINSSPVFCIMMHCGPQCFMFQCEVILFSRNRYNCTLHLWHEVLFRIERDIDDINLLWGDLVMSCKCNFFPTGRWYEIEALCLLFAGNCLKTNETEPTHYTSRSCDIIHVRLLHFNFELARRVFLKDWPIITVNLANNNTIFVYLYMYDNLPHYIMRQIYIPVLEAWSN